MWGKYQRSMPRVDIHAWGSIFRMPGYTFRESKSQFLLNEDQLLKVTRILWNQCYVAPTLHLYINSELNESISLVKIVRYFMRYCPFHNFHYFWCWQIAAILDGQFAKN